LKFHLPKLAKDSAYVIISQGITYVTGGLWGVLLARWLGAEYFGTYLYYAGIFSIASAIGEFGTIGYLMRELNAKEDSKSLFSFFVNKQVLIVSLLFVFSILFLFFSESNFSFLLVGVSTSIFIFSDSLTNVLGTWFYTRQKAPFISNLAIFKSSGTLIGGFFIHLLSVPVYFLIFVPAFFSFLRFIYLIYVLIREYDFSISNFFRIHFIGFDFVEIIRKTWIFGSFSIFSVIQAQIDPVILKVLKFTPYDFGIIGAANRIRGIINMTGGAILNVIYPSLSKDYKKDPALFSRNLLAMLKPLIVFIILSCTFLICFSKEIINILLGDQYADSVPFMRLFSIGSIVPLLMLLSSAGIASGKEGKILIYSLVLSILTPLLKLLLIPTFGSIFIGWLEAITPWINLLFFFILLKPYFIPRLEYSFFWRLIMIVMLGIILPLLLIYLHLNIYLVFFISISTVLGLGSSFYFPVLRIFIGSDKTLMNKVG
jgi:O-antigen/teichoic acid export membrane protein